MTNKKSNHTSHTIENQYLHIYIIIDLESNLILFAM